MSNPCPKFKSLQPAVDPKNLPGFLIDWELTLKCNLDCPYCSDSPEPGEGGHWTLAEHPPVNECLRGIDFFYEYTDLYMQTKPRWNRRVVLNVYGGESLFHPDIVQILQACHTKYQKYDWPLTITTTSNAVVGARRMAEIIPLIDEFTLSFHVSALPKQKKLFKENVLKIKDAGKRLKIIVMMSVEYEVWPELLELIEWCKNNNIRYVAKAVDGFFVPYNKKQLEWFAIDKKSDDVVFKKEKTNLSEQGRSCCGGRQMCTSNNLKEITDWVQGNNFTGWSCSVNHFFLFVKQHDGKIFVNKDCRMDFDSRANQPIGNLSDPKKLLDYTKENIKNKTLPVITCARDRCRCGLCAPKADSLETLNDIMKIHLTPEYREIFNSN